RRGRRLGGREADALGWAWLDGTSDSRAARRETTRIGRGAAGPSPPSAKGRRAEPRAGNEAQWATCFVPGRHICEGCSGFPNGSVARGARFGKAASRTVRDDRVGFPASECVEAELCFPSKAQRAFCAPCPEGEAARVDPNARLRRRDRPTPEHAPQRRKGRSARPHLFDPVACGDLAVPRSRPTLLWKGSRRLDEHVSGAGWPGCFDTDAYGPA